MTTYLTGDALIAHLEAENEDLRRELRSWHAMYIDLAKSVKRIVDKYPETMEILRERN